MSYEVIEQNKEHMTWWKGFVLSILRQLRVVGITGQLARVTSRSLQLIVVFVLAVSGFTGLIVTAIPGIAAAANPFVTWSIQQSYPAPASSFSSVSCPTSSDCFAVGGNNTGIGPALYETTDDGSTWVNDTASLPSSVGKLNGVSCISANSCEAVGSNSSGNGGVALSWNDSAWSSQTLPSGVPNLYGVSCVSASSCEAVGNNFSITDNYNYTFIGVALSWNGTTWTNQTLPSGVGGLNSVSCTSASYCEAVGYNSSGNYVVALSWNGSTWTNQTLPSGVGGLNSVSCTSVSFCMAVGDKAIFCTTCSSGAALSWNGTTWTNHTLPSSVNNLNSVSCTSATFCEAVGESNSSGNYVVALSWNGTTWTNHTLPSSVGQLNGVSCISANSCEAVGSNSSGNYVVALGWNGSAWSNQTIPSGVGWLNGVSCISASSCEAVGYNSSYNGVALGWNGSAWSNQTIPSGVNVLNGVSCTSATFCEAVGYNSSGGGVALSWNGSAWSSQTLPSSVYVLYGVSCTSATFCEAVGYNSSGNSVGIALSWNGTTWTNHTLPSGVNVLNGVSCTSVSFCMAVGDKAIFCTTCSSGAALSWNGTTWTNHTLPSSVNNLNSVSCTSATFCEAVGYNSSGNSVGIALSWNGTTWTSQTLPSGVGWLNSVSCISASSCEAVGSNSSGGVVLSWNGSTWTSQTLPSGVGWLNSVSCISASSCEAVGGTFNDIVILTTATTITSITPDSSPLAGGGTATIIGTNFASDSTVMFGSITATATTVVSSTKITATIPPATSPGLVEVTVQASGKTSAGSGFMYVTSGIPYTPVTPYRIADTRCSQSPQPSFCAQENLPSANQSLSSPPAGGSITVQVTGTGSGTNGVPVDAQSVIVTVTAIAATTAHSGYLTVYPTGTNPPTASSLNYAPGMAIPNLVTATLGSGGAIDILSSSANVNIVVDVEGYYEPSTSTTTNKFTPLPLPIRVLDTRCTMSPPPSGISTSYCSSLPSTNDQIPAPKPNKYIEVQITGVGGSSGVPVTATAVSLVVTAADPSSSGFLTVFPAGSSTTPPETSNVNFHANVASADSVTVGLGSTGAIYIYNSANTSTNVVVDVNGYFSSTGDLLTPSSPVRICDTRSSSSIGGLDVASGVSGQCNNSGTPLSSSSGPITIQVTGIAGIPTSAKVVVANITVVNTTGSGYLTAWAAGATQPTTSNINWGKGQVMPNMVLSTLNSSGQMDIYCSSQANIIVDVVGWYS